MKKKPAIFEKALEYFEIFRNKAIELFNDDEKIEGLLVDAENKLKEIPKIGDKASMIPVLISMVRSYIKGEYRKVSKGTIITIIGTLIYLISPVDALLDKIPIIGFLDDIFIINLCLSYIKKDIDEYKEWQMNK